MCSIINNKKKVIRTLQREIDGVEEPILVKEESKLNLSFRKPEDDLNQSQTYSLSDLI
jgi:hypothetical protein